MTGPVVGPGTGISPSIGPGSSTSTGPASSTSTGPASSTTTDGDNAALARVHLFGRPGCHLCDLAREIVEQVSQAAGERWLEIDVDSDPELRGEWGDLVPVVLVDGVCLGYYQIDPGVLAAALAR